jgi:hypothetical protein
LLLLSSSLYTEDGGSEFLGNVGNYLQATGCYYEGHSFSNCGMRTAAGTPDTMRHNDIMNCKKING